MLMHQPSPRIRRGCRRRPKTPSSNSRLASPLSLLPACTVVVARASGYIPRKGGAGKRRRKKGELQEREEEAFFRSRHLLPLISFFAAASSPKNRIMLRVQLQKRFPPHSPALSFSPVFLRILKSFSRGRRPGEFLTKYSVQGSVQGGEESRNFVRDRREGGGGAERGKRKSAVESEITFCVPLPFPHKDMEIYILQEGKEEGGNGGRAK